MAASSKTVVADGADDGALTKPAPPPPASSLKTSYLALYNFISAVAWLTVLGRVALLLPLRGYPRVFLGVNEFLKWTQTAAILEVVHAALGVVRSPVLTAAMQVASRYALVWGVLLLVPAVAGSPIYSSMLLAWSATEVIRYSFFALALSSGQDAVPDSLVWLRYNTFFVLYPIGISSEVWLMYLSLGEVDLGQWNSLYRTAVLGTMAIYVPGSYILYTHMMDQRRSKMRAKKAKKVE